MPVTINSIRDGVISTLDSHFPEIPVMGEEIEQGLSPGMDLEPPCFFVKMLMAGQTQELNIRYSRTHSFDLHYFAVDRKNRAMHDMAEQLYEHMDLIDIDGLLYRGTNMNHEIVDEVLHFFVDYTFRVRRQEPEIPDMQTLEHEEGIKT